MYSIHDQGAIKKKMNQTAKSLTEKFLSFAKSIILPWASLPTKMVLFSHDKSMNVGVVKYSEIQTETGELLKMHKIKLVVRELHSDIQPEHLSSIRDWCAASILQQFSNSKDVFLCRVVHDHRETLSSTLFVKCGLYLIEVKFVLKSVQPLAILFE